MGSRTWLVGAAVAGIAVAATVAVFRLDHARDQQRWGLFRVYCTDCHNKDDLAGNVSFQGVTPESVAEHPEVFEAAVRKLRGHLMPPPGNPQPNPGDADSLIATLETSIDANAKARPQVGYVPAQRLNRTEYANAVKELLDVDIDPARVPAARDRGQGLHQRRGGPQRLAVVRRAIRRRRERRRAPRGRRA